MIIGIMQPYFFPYIGYWQLINTVDKFIIYDDVNYIKGGWINRNKILMNGEGRFITLQLNGASSHKHINETEIFTSDIYKRKFLKTLETYYRKAPYYQDVIPIINSIVLQDEKILSRYLELLIRRVCDYLAIKTELIVSSEIVKKNELKGQDKVLEICNLIGAKVYINAIGGKQLYSSGDFAARGVALKFIQSGNIKYRQFENDFIPNLSIIDVMMFNPVESIITMLDEYELI